MERHLVRNSEQADTAAGAVAAPALCRTGSNSRGCKILGAACAQFIRLNQIRQATLFDFQAFPLRV